MSIFNEYGNLEPVSSDIVELATENLFDEMKLLLKDLSLTEIRALEQIVVQSVSVRFAEARLRRGMKHE